MKKAQVTIFIIIGIVLVIAIGMMIYLFSSKSTQTTEQEVVGQRLRQQAVKAINDYITSCLDVVASQALDLVGKQGGVLFQSQGGSYPDPTPAGKGTIYLDYDDKMLMYNIIPPQGSVGTIFFSTPPDYPWQKFPYVNGNTQDYGYFGISKLPPLYKSVSGAMSIQEQLENYIVSNTVKCTDWSSFEEQGLNVQAGTPSVQMVIAENTTELAVEEYVSFLLKWPVTIKEYATQAQTTLNEFAVSYPIRFATIYYSVRDIIDKEVSNISYEPETTANYFITINNNIFNKDDVILYQDKQAKLKGMPYEFRIARKNRPPALHWINQAKIDSFHYCVGNIISFAGNSFDFTQRAVVEASTPPLSISSVLPVKFNASDPDNDQITFVIDPTASQINNDVDKYWFLWAVATYQADPNTGGLKITVKANDGELEDSQQIRFIPVGCADET